METSSSADAERPELQVPRGSVLTQALSEMSQQELLKLGAEHSLRLAREQSRHSQLVARSNELMEKLTSTLTRGLPTRCLLVSVENCLTDIFNEQVRNNELLKANNDLLESLLKQTRKENELLTRNNELHQEQLKMLESQGKYFDCVVRQACTHMVLAIDDREKAEEEEHTSRAESNTSRKAESADYIEKELNTRKRQRSHEEHNE